MRRKFLVTFGEVAAAFGRNFSRLFGGGTGPAQIRLPSVLSAASFSTDHVRGVAIETGVSRSVAVIRRLTVARRP